MDLNDFILSSWTRLRELLETADPIRQNYVESASVCVSKTSNAYLVDRTKFYKKKHKFTKNATLFTRVGVIEKDMKAHALAVYKAWGSLAELNAEYLAILTVQNDKAAERAERDDENKERIDDLQDAADRTKRRIQKKLARRLKKEAIELGENEEDAIDALEDAALEQKEEEYNRKEKEKEKEEEAKSALRIHVLTSYCIEEANQLLGILSNVNSKEFASYLPKFNANKKAQIQKNPPQPKSQSLLNTLFSDIDDVQVKKEQPQSFLDYDAYDEYDESIASKKRKSQDSDSDSVTSPKSVRMDALSNSMSSVNITNSPSV